jgi:DNA-directed RNA polymerase specialized sigma24 family protein
MVDLLRYLRDRQVIVKSNAQPPRSLTKSVPDLRRVLPESAWSMIEAKIDQLTDRDREIFTAAAVEGVRIQFCRCRTCPKFR